jgi:hypothetical protein
MTDITGGTLGDFPNKKYEQFFAKFKEIESLDIAQFKPVHLIGYFCKKYKTHFNIDYKFKFNSPAPSKCFEVFQIKKLGMLLSSDPKILKDYIDWVFSDKVVKAKRRITSISFMTAEGVANEYKMNILLAGDRNQNIDRSTLLPNKYQQIFTDRQVFANTYGDVAFLSQMDPMSSEVADALDCIEKLGFDMNVLKRIV